MTPIPLLAPLLALIPGFATHLATIMSGLKSAIQRFHKPELVPLINPLQWRINNLSVRLQRLLALLAAGRQPRQYKPRPGRTKAAPPALSPDQIAQQAPSRLLPTSKAWVFRAWEGKVATQHFQLYNLLIQPEMVELLAAEPALGRILRPLCHMLGLPKPGERKPDPKPYRPTPPPPLPPATPYPPPLTRTEQWSREWNRLKAR